MTSDRPKIVIRRADTDDLDAIVSLWMDMMHEHEEFDERVRLSVAADEAYRNYACRHIENPEAPVFVADHSGRIIGFCLAYVARSLPMFRPSSYGFISDLMVMESWRRQGVGRSLLGAVQQWLREQGVRSIQLQVYSRNTAAVAFWSRLGFQDFVHGLWMQTPPE